MQPDTGKIHTTLNLSSQLILQAQRIFKGRTKTEIIHEALRRMIQMEKLEHHLKKWKGRGSFKSYE